jgi:hypothetical protein
MSRIFRYQLALVGLMFCVLQGSASADPATPRYDEKNLTRFIKDADGVFSPFWVAYFLLPEKGKPRQYFIEVNGNKLGPYEDIDPKGNNTPDGEHIVLAGKKAGRWIIIVDGVEKYDHADLLWPTLSWYSGLSHSRWNSERQAAVLRFSSDGRTVFYPAKADDGKWAMFTNGVPGAEYNGIGTDVESVNGSVLYVAFSDKKQTVKVLRDRELGPYDSTWASSISENNMHFTFRAQRGTENLVVFDGTEISVEDKPLLLTVNNNGDVVYVIRRGSKFGVNFNRTLIPGEFDNVESLRLSPEGKLAFWASIGGRWTVRADGKDLPGGQGPYEYAVGNKHYNLMWGADADHVGYFVKEGNGGAFYVDGKKIPEKIIPLGLRFATIVDGAGHPAGEGYMDGPAPEPEALVQAALAGSAGKCTPFSASLLGNVVSCTNRTSKGVFMQIGDKAEGPYASIRGVLIPLSGSSYAYAVERTDGKKCLVVDGSMTSQTFDDVYNYAFKKDENTLYVLARRGSDLIQARFTPGQ